MTKINELEPLGYDYAALEPHIDARTMEIHYSKHHQAYFNKLNAALKDQPELQAKTVEEIITNINSVPENIRTAVRNNGGGHLNHTMFWKVLKKDVPFQGPVAEAIKAKWKDFESFKSEFTSAAATRFGSGWAWLVVDKNRELAITSTANQDSPYTEGQTPILMLDVWEHAYYLKYQNKRPDYIEAFFQVINWEQVNKNFLVAKK
ncbi:superoxide dismutase [Candidatus Woesearchaeota archaeon]|nr:superoxide dismutase [Candidatus Woesearchaeota archaeon]